MTIDVEATIFNPVQQHLLKMFAYDGSEERLSEVKEVLSRHFFRKLDIEGSVWKRRYTYLADAVYLLRQLQYI